MILLEVIESEFGTINIVKKRDSGVGDLYAGRLLSK